MKKILLAIFALVLVLATVVVLVSINKTSTELTDGFSQGVPYIQLRGPIDGNGVRKFSKLLDSIEASNPKHVILAIDSPGGELQAGFNLSDRILDSKVPIYCLVQEGMATALYAVASSDHIYFLKNGAVGSAEVIYGHPTPEIKRLQDKLTLLVHEHFEKISSRTGIDIDLLLAMTDSELKLIRDGNVITKKGELLSLNANMASQLGFSSGTVDSIEELAMKIKDSDNQTVDTNPISAPI